MSPPVITHGFRAGAVHRANAIGDPGRRGGFARRMTQAQGARVAAFHACAITRVSSRSGGPPLLPDGYRFLPASGAA